MSSSNAPPAWRRRSRRSKSSEADRLQEGHVTVGHALAPSKMTTGMTRSVRLMYSS